MATHSLTATKLINWMSAELGSNATIAATPSTESLALLTQALNAAITQVTAYYTLPDPYTDDVEIAILSHAADLWASRKNVNGLSGAFNDFGPVRVPSSFNPSVLTALAPYKSAWFNNE